MTRTPNQWTTTYLIRGRLIAPDGDDLGTDETLKDYLEEEFQDSTLRIKAEDLARRYLIHSGRDGRSVPKKRVEGD